MFDEPYRTRDEDARLAFAFIPGTEFFSAFMGRKNPDWSSDYLAAYVDGYSNGWHGHREDPDRGQCSGAYARGYIDGRDAPCRIRRELAGTYPIRGSHLWRTQQEEAFKAECAVRGDLGS